MKIRTLHDDVDPMLIFPAVTSKLQRHPIKEHLFPNLETLRVENVVRDFIPVLTLFFSPKITTIDIRYCGNPAEASAISTLSALCPNLQNIRLYYLSRDSATMGAVSDMLITRGNALDSFYVTLPLTEEARGVVCKLPNLRGLLLVVEKDTTLPPLVLPELTHLILKLLCDDGDQLRTFSKATLGKLQSVILHFPGRASLVRPEYNSGVPLWHIAPTERLPPSTQPADRSHRQLWLQPFLRLNGG